MNTQISSVNQNKNIENLGNKIHACFGNLHGRLVRAIKNVAPSFAKFFEPAETINDAASLA